MLIRWRYEKLHFQSIRDGLTELYNRRFLEESLDYELLRATRLNKPLCDDASHGSLAALQRYLRA
ncbi:MAG: hypothetical protein Fur005_43600 [Roseiflexaceae bacterium]